MRDNLLGFGIWASDASADCGRSFFRAFNGHYDEGFHGAAGTLVGYRLPDGTVQPLANVAANVTDEYERLLKAIAGYNGGANRNQLVNCSLPDILTAAPASRCRSHPSIADYAMGTLHDGHSGRLSLPYRTYIWRGDVNADGSPWCFAYGEQEWRSPFTVREPGRPNRNATFEDYREEAADNPGLRVECQ